MTSPSVSGLFSTSIVMPSSEKTVERRWAFPRTKVTVSVDGAARLVSGALQFSRCYVFQAGRCALHSDQMVRAGRYASGRRERYLYGG